jgi:hypothetical protein
MSRSLAPGSGCVDIDVLQEMNSPISRKIDFIEAVLLRGPRKPLHCFWRIFHDVLGSYVVVGLPDPTSGGTPPLLEARIRLDGVSGIRGHPTRSHALLAEEPFLGGPEVCWAAVPYLHPWGYYAEQTSPESFHLSPKIVQGFYDYHADT